MGRSFSSVPGMGSECRVKATALARRGLTADWETNNPAREGRLNRQQSAEAACTWQRAREGPNIES